MEVTELNMPRILPDNEVQYIETIKGILSSIDPLCTLQITRKISAYNFRIAPTNSEVINNIFRDIQSFNTMLNIRVNFSKSIKSSSVIAFDIEV